MKSKIAFLIIILIYVASFNYYSNYKDFLKGGGDSWGYYAYLPATFIYHDLDDLQQTIAKRAAYNTFGVRKHESGYLQIEEAHAFEKNTVIKYTNGVAILYAPFFFAAHIFCHNTNLYAADGYTLPYNLMIGIATLLYSLGGLWLLRKLLSRYFSNSITAIVLLAIGLGTNLYFFSVSHLGMSHPFLFALYALCLYSTDQFYITQKKIFAVLIGFSCGMVTLIRPNEIIIVLFPLLWNVTSLNSLKERLSFAAKNLRLYDLMAFVFLLCNLPQLIYWKILTGNLIFYSYTKEGFDFLHPHIKEGLFGFSNGWLSYTPIMIFAVAGLLFLPKYFKKSMLPSFLFIPVFIWVIYSWWCWQYINGFGSRPMIETYSIWAFPMACFLFAIWEKNILKLISLLLLSFFLVINLFQTWQYERGLIWTEDSNWAYYKAIFLKTRSSYDAHIAYDCNETQPDTSSLQFMKRIGTLSFDDSLSMDYISSVRKSDNYAFELRKGTTPVIHTTAVASGAQPLDYFRVSCWVYCNELQYNHYRQAVLAAEFKHNGSQIRWRSVRLQTKIDNPKHLILHNGKTGQWQYVSFFVRAPHRFKTGKDELNVLAWNPENTPIIIDDIKVEWWKKK
ncbi:MAG: hypothetical protein U0T69_05005 [Chitinophagales bacterium]